MSSTNDIMTVVGIIGGFAISLSLVPQVYLTYKTRCADDISYFYQGIYIFGTALVNVYAIYFGLFAVYIPCLLELSLIVCLTIMKIMYPAREDLVDQMKEVAVRHSISVGSTGQRSSLAMSRHKSMAVLKRLSLAMDLETETDVLEKTERDVEKSEGRDIELAY